MLLVVEPNAVDVDLAHEVNSSTSLWAGQPLLESTPPERRTHSSSPIDEIRFETRRLCGLLPSTRGKRRLWKLPTSMKGRTPVRIVDLGLDPIALVEARRYYSEV